MCMICFWCVEVLLCCHYSLIFDESSNSCRGIIATHICCLLVQVLSFFWQWWEMWMSFATLYRYFWLDGFIWGEDFVTFSCMRYQWIAWLPEFWIVNILVPTQTTPGSEAEDTSLRLDRGTYQYMYQDIVSIKTMLLKLKRVLQEVCQCKHVALCRFEWTVAYMNRNKQLEYTHYERWVYQIL